MGKMKEKWMDEKEGDWEIEIAKKLNITVEELHETDWNTDSDLGTEGEELNHYVYFKKIPSHLKEKLKDYENGRLYL